jgi:hypothetical protein
MLKKVFVVLAVAIAAVAVVLTTQAEPENGHDHNHDMHMQHPRGGAVMSDNRTLVHFPDYLRIHTLASMRDHLQALSEIQAALANEKFDKAGEIAEQRLGMSSLKLHGAHEVAPYMPKAMQDMGTTMHHSASRFAIAAGNAAVNGDVKPALAALSEVTRSCVACHSRFRLH